MASKWGRLPAEDRARAARAGERYGLSRDAVRGRFNRGTYNPLSDDPIEALPREVRRYVIGSGGGVITVDWQAAAERNMRLTFQDYFKFNEQTVVGLTEQMSDALAEFTATASENDLLALASIQPDAEGNPPPIEDWPLPPNTNLTIDDLDMRVNGEWYNPFWYH
jgi:hypothetical protein